MLIINTVWVYTDLVPFWSKYQSTLALGGKELEVLDSYYEGSGITGRVLC